MSQPVGRVASTPLADETLRLIRESAMIEQTGTWATKQAASDKLKDQLTKLKDAAPEDKIAVLDGFQSLQDDVRSKFLRSVDAGHLGGAYTLFFKDAIQTLQDYSAATGRTEPTANLEVLSQRGDHAPAGNAAHAEMLRQARTAAAESVAPGADAPRPVTGAPEGAPIDARAPEAPLDVAQQYQLAAKDLELLTRLTESTVGLGTAELVRERAKTNIEAINAQLEPLQKQLESRELTGAELDAARTEVKELQARRAQWETHLPRTADGIERAASTVHSQIFRLLRDDDALVRILALLNGSTTDGQALSADVSEPLLARRAQLLGSPAVRKMVEALGNVPFPEDLQARAETLIRQSKAALAPNAAPGEASTQADAAMQAQHAAFAQLPVPNFVAEVKSLAAAFGQCQTPEELAQLKARIAPALAASLANPAHREAIVAIINPNFKCEVLSANDAAYIAGQRDEIARLPGWNAITEVVNQKSQGNQDLERFRLQCGFTQEESAKAAGQTAHVETNKILPPEKRAHWPTDMNRAYENYWKMKTETDDVLVRTANDIRSILNSGMPIEFVIMVVMMALNEREEAKTRLKIEEVTLAEQMQRYGYNASEYGLPAKSANMLMQELQAQMTMFSQVMQALSNVLRQLQDLVGTPLRHIRT